MGLAYVLQPRQNRFLTALSVNHWTVIVQVELKCISVFYSIVERSWHAEQLFLWYTCGKADVRHTTNPCNAHMHV